MSCFIIYVLIAYRRLVLQINVILSSQNVIHNDFSY